MHRLVAIAVALGTSVAHSDPSTAQAIWADADRAAAVAEFSRAAGLFEEYATRFVTEANAFEALRRAIAFRAALGDTAKWRTDVSFATRRFGKVRPGDVAALVFALRDDNRAAHLRSYLRDFGAQGGVERQVLAHVELGIDAWERACPGAVDGLCVRLVESHPESCTRSKIHASSARAPALAKQAASDFAEAIRLADAMPALKSQPQILAAYATAKFALADADFEALASMPFPKLHFGRPGPSKRSRQRLREFLATQTIGGGKLTEKYEAIVRLGPSRTIAAMARIGQHARYFGERLLGASPPLEVRRRADHILESYCDAIVDHTDALFDHASRSFEACLVKSNAQGVHDAWSRACERELVADNPLLWPPLREKLAPPGAPPTFLVVGRVDVALESEPQQ